MGERRAQFDETASYTFSCGLVKSEYAYHSVLFLWPMASLLKMPPLTLPFRYVRWRYVSNRASCRLRSSGLFMPFVLFLVFENPWFYVAPLFQENVLRHVSTAAAIECLILRKSIIRKGQMRLKVALR